MGLGRITPTGFLPEDDQGAFFVVVQLPDGASIGRTTDVVQQVEDILKQEHAIADYSSTIGLNFIDNYSQPNAAFLIVSLKPFEERTEAIAAAQAIIARLGQKLRAGARRHAPCRSRRRRSSASAPAAGSATCCRTPAAAIRRRWRRCCADCWWRPTRIRSSARVFSTFSATNPSIYLDIDRDKAQILGVDHQQHLPGAAGLARRLLRQRHEPVRPHLAGAGAGARPRTARRSTTSTGSTCATRRAR